jgi:serine protease Do
LIEIINEIKADDVIAAEIMSDKCESKSGEVVTEKSYLPPEYQKLVEAIVTIEVHKDQRLPMHLKGDKIRKAHGTSFFINDKGILITNSHVIKDSDKIIVFFDGREYIPDIIAADQWNDLALLDIRRTGTPFVEFASGDSYHVGQEVSAVGSPIIKYLEHSISKGIISSIREIGGYRLIQTDAAINPGSSGGPLVKTENNKVIGIVTLTVRGEGLGFAIPVETINSFLNSSGITVY